MTAKFSKSIIFSAVLTAIMISINTVACQKNLFFSEGDTVYVHSFGGLNLRDSVGVNSNVLTSLNHSLPLIVLDINERHFEIDNRVGKWLRVQSPSKKVGYVFSGYLSKFEPYSYIKDEFEYNQDICLYEVLEWVLMRLNNHDSLIYTTKNIFNYSLSSKNYTSSNHKYYKSGSQVIYESGYEYQYAILELTEISINELLNAVEYHYRYGQKMYGNVYTNGFKVEQSGEYYNREIKIDGGCKIKLKKFHSRTLAEFLIYSL